MGVPSDLTSQHAKIDANLSLMRGHLDSMRSGDESTREAFEKLQPWTEQIGQMLRGYVDQEQSGLLKQAARILGESLEEISEITDHATELLDRYEHFVVALEHFDRTRGGNRAEDALVELRERLEEFIGCFERHRDAERNFYSLYSTILFPSGAATD